jgi:acyl carrier protein
MYEKIYQSILEVAPDLSEGDLAADVDLHGDLGLDSIDLVNIAASIAGRTGFEIPDSELAGLHTVGDLVTFVESHVDDGDR